MSTDNSLNEVQLDIFTKIGKNDVNSVRQLLAQLKDGVNFVDDNGMTPLQHACCKGNKEIVSLLLDMGADINFSKHGADYTPLHFAALSGNTEVCRMLLDRGINPKSINSVSRTAAQMAAFVGNYACVESINNYIPRAQLEYYTQPQGQQTEPLLPPTQLDAFHDFVSEISLHPVRIALNLQNLGLLKHLASLKKVLELMCEKEMKKTYDVSEVLAFKFHYLRWIVSEIMRCEEQYKTQRKEKAAEDAGSSKNDFIELFIKRVLKENKLGQLDYVEYTIRESVREFAFRESSVYHAVVSQLTSNDPPPALSVLRTAINGHRPFTNEENVCSTCGNEKPDKKCSKCKTVQYCDRECQRLHWFMHKKSCARPTNATANKSPPTVEPIDVNELMSKLKAGP